MRPVFNQCCCCFSLETGAQIIGWFYAVIGVLATIACIILAVAFGIYEDPKFDEFRTGMVFNLSVLS